MQLIQNGPDIPERLLQAHEDGRVVFFCGAGVSFPAGLPGFRKLVERIRDNLGLTFTEPQKSAFKRGLYDAVLGLLEGEIVGNRERVRREIAAILTPDLKLPNAMTTHEALLELSRTRDRRQRLITTNFDRMFEEAKARNNLNFRSYEAPLLPVPKNRWDGVVYLHGLLAERPAVSDLDRLVVTSGDFELAYLTERWAARFASELFRSVTVCFVGYSIDDPVLRYMMDALAADRLLGEATPEVFAFGSFTKGGGGHDAAAAEWRAKNVTPILYRDDKRHGHLHQTLHEWARIYRDGVLGKESIVSRHAISKPIGSTKEDDYVGRLLWALSDRSGLPAKRFAQFDPKPPLDWLDPLLEDRHGHDDLERFGVRANARFDETLKFSMLVRPSPYTLSAPMRLVRNSGQRDGNIDEVMSWLAHWLARHVDDERLLLWVAGHGRLLHSALTRHIERALKLYQVRVPMVRLWRLVLAGRLYDLTRPLDVYSWRELLAQGYSPARRLELKELLEPRILLSRPFKLGIVDSLAPVGEARIKNLVEWEIVLSTNDARTALEGLANDPHWRSALTDMMADFTNLLRDAFDLMRELEGADDRSDSSYIGHPSISVHEQNRGFRGWSLLVDLTRDAWLETAEASRAVARVEVERWLSLPYPIFRRLAFFAATHRNVFSAQEALEMVLLDVWWLWSIETQREALRLLVSVGPELDQVAADRLQAVILQGPDRRMFRGDVAAEEFDRISNQEIWLRLVKFRDAGGALSSSAGDWLEANNQKYTHWQREGGERDEFPFWLGEGLEWGSFTATPRDLEHLISWLCDNQTADDMHRDDWQQRCKSEFPRTAAALIGLAQQDQWHPDRWRSALHAWSEGVHLWLSWRWLARPLTVAPDELLREAGYAVSSWLEAQSKKFLAQEEHFFTLARRFVILYRNDAAEAGNDVVSRAINHPLGHTVQSLLNWWLRQSPRDGQGLREEVAHLFTELSKPDIAIYRYGRVLLGAYMIALFRVDRDWTIRHLIPLLDWQNSEVEAAAIWKGFLWGPRVHRPLMAEIKTPFLATAHHYEQLGDHAEQYAGLLTYVVLEAADLFTPIQKRTAMAALPDQGLQRSAQTVIDTLEAAGEQRVENWRNRVRPFIETIWPQAAARRTRAISEKFARICIASGDAFEEAYATVRPWLMSSDQPSNVTEELAESRLCATFPETALGLLNSIIANELQWPPSKLAECLDQIRGARSELEDDVRYRRLNEVMRRWE